ncbi:MAG TPA: hypothetical protein VLE93_02070 [Candidatus Saccharimonadales bacterium]|nr:hypothetical protein [Candidatus Saccharimonadales bacterium]
MRALKKRFTEAANRVIAPGKTTVSAPACGSVVVTVLVVPQLVTALAALELEELETAAAAAAEALGQFCEATMVLPPALAEAEELAAELALDELDEPELEPAPEPLLLPEPALPLAPAPAEAPAPAPAEAEPWPALAEAELDEDELELEELELELEAALTKAGVDKAIVKATKMETIIVFFILFSF